LFNSIKPLFVGKPIVVAVNKIDVTRPEKVDPEDWALIESLQDPAKGGIGGVQIIPMSTLTEEGVTNVKQIVRLPSFLAFPHFSPHFFPRFSLAFPSLYPFALSNLI
jgi:GTPase Era involved in 16S rRNA processing